MNLRPKMKRRLVILLGVLFSSASIAFGIYAHAQYKIGKRIDEERAAAMAAYRAGDYAGALPHFNFYLDKTKTQEKGPGKADTEALFAYGKSRMNVPLAKGQHLTEAKNIF